MKGLRLDISSARLALALIALLVLLIVISAILPQEEPGSRGIRNSQIFLATLGFLAINLAAGNIKRFRAIRRLERGVPLVRHLGSVVFHLALLMIIIGVVLNSLFRFEGVFGLTEGQTLRDVPGDYFRVFEGPFHRDVEGRFTITLDRVDREFPVGDAHTEAALIRLEPVSDQFASGEVDRARGQVPIHINHPLRWGGLEFHYGSTTGYSPEVVILDDSGRELFHSFVRLKTRFEGDRPYGEDYILIPGEDLEILVHVEASPDQGPTCRLLVKQGTMDLFDGVVEKEDAVVAGKYRITVPRLRNWCYVNLVSNPWLTWVFGGFWICLAGLAVRAFAQLIGDRRSQE